MDNFNEQETMQDEDMMSRILFDEYQKYEEASEEDKKVILDRIERLERIAHQKNEDILKYNQIELDQEKLEETKRQYDENQQREIERWTDEKEFRDADIQARRDNLLITQNKDKKDLILDVAKIAVPVAVAIGEGIFIYHMQTKTMVFERDGNIWGRSAASKLSQRCLDNYARKIS